MHRYHAALIGILMLAGIIGYTLYTPVAQAPTEDQERIEVTLSIEDIYPTKNSTVPEGTTALQLLHLARDAAQFSLSEKEYPGMGTLVEKIGDKENGLGNKYWMYYVNAAFAPVGADVYVLKPGDAITWKFEVPTQY